MCYDDTTIQYLNNSSSFVLLHSFVLSLILLLSSNMATPTSTSGIATSSPLGHGDTPRPVQPSDTNNRTGIVIQHNNIGDGVTINISSDHGCGSTVTKLEHDSTTQSASTSLQRPLTRQLVPVDYNRKSEVVLSGNTFGRYAVVNIGSSYSTGAVEQTVLPSQTKRTKKRTRRAGGEGSSAAA